MQMDHAIYGRLGRTDLGVYGTRRYPKGVAALPSLPAGPTQPQDPNANPQPIALIFRSTSEPVHAEVTRWQYTVPVGRRAVVQAALVEHSRNAAVAGATMATSMIRINRKNYAGTAVDVVRVVSHDNNSLADSHRLGNGVQIDMFEGDTIFANTALGIGSAAMLAEAVLIEYDAVYRARQGYAIGNSFNNGAAASVSGSGGLLSSGSLLNAPSGGGGYQTMIRVVPGSEYRYIAEGWTYLGGGFLGR